LVPPEVFLRYRLRKNKKQKQFLNFSKISQNQFLAIFRQFSILKGVPYKKMKGISFVKFKGISFETKVFRIPLYFDRFWWFRFFKH